MALEIKQTLRQTQQLVMTPQLQQAIKLLQYNHIEVVNALEHELRENPLLEVSTFDEPLAEQDNRNDLKALEDAVKESEAPGPEVFDVDWESYLESYGGDYAPAQKDFADKSPIEMMATYQENLFDILIQQLQLSHIEGIDRRIAFELIGNIDERGYLDVEIAQIAEQLEVAVTDVERVLKLVQKFDPKGVGARNLHECLRLQAEALDPPEPLALQILDEALDLLEKDKLDVIAKKFKVTLEEVKAAADVISTLDPKPGRPFANSDTIYIVPDIYIVKSGNVYDVMLNDDGMPRLKISSFYQKELHSGVSTAIAKDYIQEKMRGAMWLIKSIQQRQRTIYRVTQSIIKFQREFFDKGIDYLKPLILKDVAEDVEMHESTISRVTSNKYVHTPRGIYELKYFFNSGIRHGSDAIASESVKNQIVRIVKRENPKKPVSDKQIAEELARFQIYIARRTVAKYRELLGIPQSSKRKKKF